MHILHRQLRPLAHGARLYQRSHRALIMLPSALRHVQLPNLFLHPYRHVVSILHHRQHVAVVYFPLYPLIRRPHQPTNLFEVNIRLSTILHALVDDAIHPLKHDRHPLIQLFAVLPVYNLPKPPFACTHMHASINIVHAPVHGNAHLNRSRPILAEPPPMVIYNRRLYHLFIVLSSLVNIWGNSWGNNGETNPKLNGIKRKNTPLCNPFQNSAKPPKTQEPPRIHGGPLSFPS